MNKEISKPTSNQTKSKPKMKTPNGEIKILALGGLGEVGKNCYVIDYKDEIYVIDYGVMFPDKDQLGIDYILPNYEYLLKNQHRIKGLFITHGHEDHIGGIPFLLRKVKIPKIYAPKTAKLMIEKKLKEAKIKIEITEIHDNSILDFGTLTIESFRQTHSIPDSLGFFIGTPDGNLVTTGDFKVDFSPPGQKAADFQKMVEIAKRGVMCLMSDSTNAQTPGFSLSEKTVGNNLKTLIAESTGRILFTTFASNINRVQQIIEGALENDRKICVIGRSLVNALDTGSKTKYIKVTKKDLIEPKMIKSLPADKVCIICTGSQGESLAALARIAGNLNPHFTLSENDTVVFASNPIPGNNYQIGKVIDILHQRNCKIIRNSDVFKTHASGHASQEEQKLLITLFQPEFFAPIHGTYNMQVAHKKTAIQLGVPEEKCLLIDNGDCLSFNNRKPSISRRYAPGNSMYVSGNNINVSLSESSMDKLASDGIMVFVATYNQNRKLITFPQITTRGFIVINESLNLLRAFQTEFTRLFNSNSKLEDEELQLLLNSQMSSFIFKKTGKIPLVSTNLIQYDHKFVNTLQPEEVQNQTPVIPKKVKPKLVTPKTVGAIKKNSKPKSAQKPHNKSEGKKPNQKPKQAKNTDKKLEQQN
ncbi:MAG: ribonuclease J [Mycoplasmatales bacterium]